LIVGKLGQGILRGVVNVTVIQRKCKCVSSFNGQHGMNPTGPYAHMFEEEEKRKFIQTTTEILIKKK
jgi:hypothetical protein